MKQTLSIILAFLIVPALCLAAPTPEDRVNEIISAVKTQKSMAAMMDFVHWPTTFSQMDGSAKQALKISTPEELKNHTKSFMTDPSATMRAMMKEQMGGVELPPEQMKMMESMMEAQFAKAKEKMDAEFTKFVNGKHVVKSSDIQGDAATVVVESSYQGEVESNTLEMKKVDEQWWVIESDLVKGKPAKPMMK